MKPIPKSWLLHTLREEFWASNLLQFRVLQSDHLDLSLNATICIVSLRDTVYCVLFHCCCVLAQANYLGNLFKIQIRNCLFIVLTHILTEFVSCFVSSLAVKVIKYRFVAPGEGCYQDGCVSLIKYGPCFTRPSHLNDTYFDTFRFF